MRSLHALLVEPPAWLRFLVTQLWEPVLVTAAFLILGTPGLLLAVAALISRLWWETRRERASLRERLAHEYAAGWSDNRLSRALDRLQRSDLLVLRPAGRRTRGLRIFGGQPAYLMASESAINIYDDGDDEDTTTRLMAVLAHELAHLDGRHATLVSTAVMAAFAVVLLLTGVGLAQALPQGLVWTGIVLAVALAAPYGVALVGYALQRKCEFIADRQAARRVGVAALRECLHREWHAEQLEDEARGLLAYMLEHDLPPQRQSPLMRAGFTRDIAALEESVDTARAQLDQERPGWVRLDDAPQNGLNALWGRLKRLWGQLNSDHPSLTARIQRLELKRRISS